MTAKQAALQDIQDELKQRNKPFIPFIKALNPPIRRLVKDQLHQQGYFSLPKPIGQLVARCFFTSSGVRYENYGKYYEK